MKIKPGQRFKLLANVGNQSYGPSGLRHGLGEGAVGAVRELVSAETPGAHNSEEDAVVLEFSDEQRIVGEQGEIEVRTAQRAVSFAVSAFDPKDPDHIFEATS